MFHWAYEAKVRDEALWEQNQERRNRAERFQRNLFEHLQSAIPHRGGEWLCNSSTWLSWTTSSRIPFAICFWLECNTKDILHGIQKVKVKAAILFLLLKGSGRGARYSCNTSTLSLIYGLAFVFVEQQPGLHLLYLPSNSLTASPTSGACVYLAPWQRAPASLCGTPTGVWCGLEVVKDWHGF